MITPKLRSHDLIRNTNMRIKGLSEVEFFLFSNGKLTQKHQQHLDYVFGLFEESALLKTTQTLTSKSVIVTDDTNHSINSFSNQWPIISTHVLKDGIGEIPRHPNIILYLTFLAFQDTENYNRPMLEGNRACALYCNRTHSPQNLCAQAVDAVPVKPIDSARVLLVGPQYLPMVVGSSIPPPTMTPKSIDVMFYGGIHHPTAAKAISNCIYHHRSQCIAEVQRLSDFGYIVKTGLARLTKDQYYQTLSRSRIMVSPFGNGEWSWKTYEAILHGAVPVIASKGVEAETFPPMYANLPSCQLDFRDLHKVVQSVLRNYDYWKLEIEKIRSNMFELDNSRKASIRRLESRISKLIT